MVLDNYDFTDSGGKRLRRRHLLLLCQLQGLAGAGEDAWYRAVSGSLEAPHTNTWCLAILAHIAADEQTTVTRTLSLDYLCLGLLMASASNPAHTRAERVVAKKSLSSAYLSLAESHQKLGNLSRSLNYAQESLKATHYLNSSSYKKHVVDALTQLMKLLQGVSPNEAPY